MFKHLPIPRNARSLFLCAQFHLIKRKLNIKNGKNDMRKIEELDGGNVTRLDAAAAAHHMRF